LNTWAGIGDSGEEVHVSNITFVKAKEADLETILSIYNYYIETSTATFDIGPISTNEMSQRLFVNHQKYQTYLIKSNGDTIGFCFLTQFRKKKAYDRTAEIGLYIKPEFTRKGFGKEAILFLEKVAIYRQIKVIVASISGENLASIKLVQKMGYTQCAHYREIGEKFGRLLDVIDFQKSL